MKEQLEFSEQNTTIYLTNLLGDTEGWTMAQLLPGAFQVAEFKGLGDRGVVE